MKYNKLIRDNIPEIIRNDGGHPNIHIANEKEYWEKLKEKLTEEVNEFLEDENKEEMADILEVIDAIHDFLNFDKSDIQRIKKQKRLKKGGFKKRIILE